MALDKRVLAAQALKKIFTDKITVNETLSAVSAQDRPWFRENVSGVLRHFRFLQEAASRLAPRPPKGEMRWLFLLGLYQILVQEHAAPEKIVSEGVEAGKQFGKSSAGFLNATWRRAVRERDQLREFSRAISPLPDWLHQQLERDHGKDWVASFSECVQERPRIWVRGRGEVVPGQTTSGPIQKSFLVNEGTSLESLDLWKRGELIVQNLSSQLLVERVASLLQPDDRVLDFCAAPGGKSIALAWEGMRVTAYDVSPARLKRLKENISRTQASLDVWEEENPSVSEAFDCVWVDAPCSGTGTIQKHPEMMWIRNADDVRELTRLQSEICHKAWQYVRPGGLMIYSVCSVLRSEGPELVASLEMGQLLDQWMLSRGAFPSAEGMWGAAIRKP